MEKGFLLKLYLYLRNHRLLQRAAMCKIEPMIKERTRGFLRLKKTFLRQEKKEKIFGPAASCAGVSNLSQMSATNISCDLKSWTNVVFQKIAAKIRRITEIVKMCILDSREIEIMSTGL